MKLAQLARNEPGLSGRAADALFWQAWHQRELRDMLSGTMRPSIAGDSTERCAVPSFDATRKVDGLWENYRKAALAYAGDINNAQLIAVFQPLPPMDDVEPGEDNCGWLLQSRLYGHIKLLPKLCAKNTNPDSQASSVTERPIQRSAAQDAAIVAALVRNGFDCLALPKNQAGKRGAKHKIRTELEGNPLFVGTVFDKAWERLTKHGEIAYKK